MLNNQASNSSMLLANLLKLQQFKLAWWDSALEEALNQITNLDLVCKE
jgi:hypothetical protein